MVDNLVIGMAGSGGDGIVSAGEMLLASAARQGYHGIMTKSFGSQIRGGESSCRVRLSTHRVLNPGGHLDVAVALNWEDFLKFGGELPVDGKTVVIYEARTGVPEDALPLTGISPTQVFAVPIADLAKGSAKTEKARNTVVLGLLSGWFGVGGQAALELLSQKLAKKGAELVEANRKAFQAGIDYAAEHPLNVPRHMDAAQAATPKLLTDGNSMCAAASIFAGCEFFGGYPITPSTEVMQFFTREVWKYGGAVIQAEDEIAGIGMAVGASFAGKKSMTATSGPGMSLKCEMMGLATIAELPLVVVNVQRGGPSTGLPTKSEQSDLFQAAFGAHGDALRPILAPTSVATTFDVMVEAFNVAERYQTPVIVLSDQEIAHRKETCEPIDTSKFKIEERLRPSQAELKNGYSRFRDTENRISPISHPGMPGGNYLAAGIEHNEQGSPTSSGLIHAQMNKKRFKKLEPLKARKDFFRTHGDPNAPVGLIAWGSLAGVAREALIEAEAEGLKVKLLVPVLLYPISELAFREFFATIKAGLVVEQSHQGQLYRLLRMFVDLPPGLASLARSGANPFRPFEILNSLRDQVMTMQQRTDLQPIDW